MDKTPSSILKDKSLHLDKTGPSDLRYGYCCLNCDLVKPQNLQRDGNPWTGMVCGCKPDNQYPLRTEPRFDYDTGPKFWR